MYLGPVLRRLSILKLKLVLRISSYHELVLRNSDLKYPHLGSSSASQTMSFSDYELTLRISDHELVLNISDRGSVNISATSLTSRP